jgi:hypothetical protein
MDPRLLVRDGRPQLGAGSELYVKRQQPDKNEYSRCDDPHPLMRARQHPAETNLTPEEGKTSVGS